VLITGDSGDTGDSHQKSCFQFFPLSNGANGKSTEVSAELVLLPTKLQIVLMC
jgi:hypothetical protein